VNTPIREIPSEGNGAIDWRPGKPWSLWDMLEFAASRFTGMMDLICVWTTALGMPEITIGDESLWESTRQQIRNSSKLCDELGLPVSVEALHQLELNFKSDAIGWPRDQQVLFRYARDSIITEMRCRKFLTVSPGHVRYYAQPELFGAEVFKNFSSANEDIAEAGTCLALGRGTACVMHLMRVLEAGLNALVNALQIKTKDDWGSKIREVNSALGLRASQKGPKHPDDEFYAESAAQFEYLKRAWRNPSMHLDRSYSVDRAEEILLAVKSFMAVLATKLSE
jgi:hypothetical protein